MRPRDKEKRTREASRRSCNLYHHSAIACPELEMGTWSSVLSIEKAACLVSCPELVAPACECSKAD